ncbi:DNA/RNA non-specific endonuclease [Enterococcus sp. AZ196]|uniref:DNA/RNA non-specific endonuclease n=1 Tax=Enterococcus sp. AZ196 TaxID=2774659 RepID=UPI003D2DB7F2
MSDGKLKPNIKYKTGEHGYNYQTNSKWVMEHASTDNLQFKTHEGRLPHNLKTPDKLPRDHAGYLFGDRFGGSGELDNLVSQAQKVNLSTYKKLENTWAKAIEQSKKVTVDIKVNYDFGSLRSISFEINYTTYGIDFYGFIHN